MPTCSSATPALARAGICGFAWFKFKTARARGLIRIDEGAIHRVIEEKAPASVAINGPDGMLPQVQSAALAVAEKFGIPAYVLADATWGTCDLNTNGARVLGAEILFNVGHTVGSGMHFEGTYMIDAFDDAGFEKVASKCAPLVSGKTVCLATDSQHLRELGRVRKILEEGGARVQVGPGKGQLGDGQIFGCEFYPATDCPPADVNVFMGQSQFHAAGMAASTGRPTYMLDPYFDEVRDVTGFARKLEKRASAQVYAAAEASVFGVIVGLKEGQISKTAALSIKRELEGAGKKVQLFAMTDITNERLRCLRGVDAFVQSACPRISTDNRFDVPVLSMPQARALVRVLRGREPGRYLQAPHWL